MIIAQYTLTITKCPVMQKVSFSNGKTITIKSNANPKK